MRLKSETDDSVGANGPRPQGVGAENIQIPHGSHGTLPLATSLRNRGTSSNGQTYDRSHVTGASSSTTSSHNGGMMHPNPPPSPMSHAPTGTGSRRMHQSTYSLGRNSHRQQTSHHWGRDHTTPYNRGYRTRNKPPPPTPASTDFNEESESSYAHYHGHALMGGNGGYDSEYYVGVTSRPHPPTPRSQYDLSDYGPEEDLMYPDEAIAFIPPPPTRCGSPPAEDDEDDEDLLDQ